MTLKKTLLISLLATPLLLTGCSDDPKEQAATDKPAPAAQPQAAAPAADPHAGLNIALQLSSTQGRVLSVLNSGGYSYAEVEQNGKTFWIAGTQVDIAKGDIISWGQASIMRNFTSKSLNRTFDEIYFTSTLQPIRDVGNLRPSAPGARQAAAQGAPQGTVVSVQNAAGYSYLEVNTGEGTTWVAAPQGTIKAGDVVSWQGASLMRNFTSSALGRTFDEIFFAGGVTKVQ